MKYYFGDYSAHKIERELLYQGMVKKVDPMVFRVLVFMLENPDRLLSYDELIQQVWQSRVVSNSTLNATVSMVRRAIGDSGKQQKSIKTVSGRGYRFVAKVSTGVDENSVSRNHVVGAMPSPIDRVAATTTLALPEQPSIAVMDILDMAGTQESAVLANGLTVSINSRLARLPHFFVIARASAANLSRSNLPSSEVGRQLGVRYLVYGHVQRLTKRVHATISVVDVVRNAEVWSECYDRSLDDFFQLKDDILQSIIMAIDSTIEQAEIERTFLLPPANLTAWDLYHQALSYYHQATQQSLMTARELLLQAVSLDPNFSRAYTLLSHTHTNSVMLCGSQLDYQTELQQALEYAQRAIQCCPRDAAAYRPLAKVLLLIHEYDNALEACEHALRLNPNYARGYLGHTLVCAYTGLCDQCWLSYAKMQRLNPFDPLRFAAQYYRAVSLVHQGHFDEAAALAVGAANCHHGFHNIRAGTAVCCELAGDSRQAQYYLGCAMQSCPDFSIALYQRSFQHKNESTRALFVDTLGKLGVA